MVVETLIISQGKLEETTIQYESGMTWVQWVASQYNSIGAYVDDGMIFASINGSQKTLYNEVGDEVYQRDEIRNDVSYKWW